MQDLIDRLHEFANHDFPVPEVSTYLETYQFTEMDRERYTFFEDTFYTRNLVFRDKHFEILVLFPTFFTYIFVEMIFLRHDLKNLKLFFQQLKLVVQVLFSHLSFF